MSTSAEEVIPIGEKKRSPRRKPQNRRRRNPKKAEEEGNEETNGSKEVEPREARPRPVSLPVPAELIGKSVEGIVSAVVRKGRLRFGFIHIGDIDKPEEEKPRIYFNFEEFVDKAVVPRRGYLVQFTCSTDDKSRSFASGISLTAEGKTLAAEREVAIAEKRAQKQATPEAPAGEVTGAEKVAAKRVSAPPRERKPRERRVVEGKKVTLLVSCVGHSDEKPVVVDLAQSIGRLKSNAATLFDAPHQYNIYHDGVFLTKSVLNGLQENDKIRLEEPKEAPAPKADGTAN